MKIIIKKSDLKKEISKFKMATQKATLTILKCVLMESENNTVRISVTDLEKAVSVNIPCETHKAGSLVIDFNRLKPIVENIPSDTITFENVGEKVKVSGGSFESVLENGGTKEDFPIIPTSDKAKQIFTIPALTLKDIVRKVGHSASTQEVRYVLNGVLFHNDNGLKVVATDGRRIAIAYLKSVTTNENNLKMILPFKSLKYICGLIDKDNDIIFSINTHPALDKSNLFIRQGRTVFASRLIDGNFPSYKNVIPEKINHTVEIPVKKLCDISNRMVKICKDTKIKIHTTKNNIDFVYEDEKETTKENLKVAYAGDDFSFKINMEYLRDVVSCFKDGDVKMKVVNDINPVVFEKEIYKYIIIPIRA